MNSTEQAVQGLVGRIKQQRLERGLTHAQIAQMAGTSVSSYGRFERTGEITLERLVRVLDALGLVDQLSPLAAAKPIPAGVDPRLVRVRQRGLRRRPEPGAAKVRPSAPGGSPKRSVNATPKTSPRPATGSGTLPAKPPEQAPAPPQAAVSNGAVPILSPAPRVAAPGANPGPDMTEVQRRYQLQLEIAVSTVIVGAMTNEKARLFAQQSLGALQEEYRPGFWQAMNTALRAITPADLPRYSVLPEYYQKWRATWRPEVGLGAAP